MNFDPASHRLESSLPVFRNNALVPLFLFRVRTAQKSQKRSPFVAKFWACRCAVQINLTLLHGHF